MTGRLRRITLSVPIVAALAGCGDPVQRALNAGDPFAPAGVPGRGDAVDGLEVGHRLMAAGQYELALKAYHRAAFDHGLTAGVLSAIGSAELRLGRLGQAEVHLRRAIALDEEFVPAWNNLGVVLMEKGEFGEASRVFRTAVALDSGESTRIRENLSLALAKLEKPRYGEENMDEPALVRRGDGDYLLLTSR